jgi:hypothetical protein
MFQGWMEERKSGSFRLQLRLSQAIQPAATSALPANATAKRMPLILNRLRTPVIGLFMLLAASAKTMRLRNSEGKFNFFLQFCR